MLTRLGIGVSKHRRNTTWALFGIFLAVFALLNMCYTLLFVGLVEILTQNSFQLDGFYTRAGKADSLTKAQPYSYGP